MPRYSKRFSRRSRRPSRRLQPSRKRPRTVGLGLIRASRKRVAAYTARASFKRAQGLNAARFKKLRRRRAQRNTGEEVLRHEHGPRSRKFLPAIPYRQLCDQMYPRVVERGEDLGFAGDVRCYPGTQGYYSEQYFNRIQILTWMTKSLDTNNAVSTVPISGASQIDQVFQYLGGKVTYTFSNTTSHTAQLTLWHVRHKGFANMGPTARWNVDLANDNTLTNAQLPIDESATGNTIGFRPGHGKSTTYRQYFKKMKSTTVNLEPGQTYTYIVHFKPFTMSQTRLNTEVAPAVYSNFNPVSQFILAFLHHPGLVLDPIDRGINHGSAALGCIRHFTHCYRTRQQQKGYQTYWSSTLDTEFTAEQEINQETEAADVSLVEVV